MVLSDSGPKSLLRQRGGKGVDAEIKTVNVRDVAQRSYFAGRIEALMKVCDSVNGAFDSLPSELKESLLDRESDNDDIGWITVGMMKWPPQIRAGLEALFEQLHGYLMTDNEFISVDEWELFDKVICLVQKLRLKSKQQMKHGLEMLQQGEPTYLLIAYTDQQLEVSFRHHITDETKEFFFGGR